MMREILDKPGVVRVVGDQCPFGLRQHHRTKLCGYLCPLSCPLRDKDEKSHLLKFIDITRAHPHCTMRRQVWVQQPAPCVFVHREKNMQANVYGDNFMIKGGRRELFEQLKVHTWTKSEGVLGPDPGQGDVREVFCLNRVFRWGPTSGRAEAIEIEADARHIEILIHQLNLWSAKSLATPGDRARAATLVLRYFWKAHTVSINVHACELLG